MDIIIESFLVAVIAAVFAISIKLWWSYYDLDELAEIIKIKSQKIQFTWKVFTVFAVIVIAVFETVYWAFIKQF